MFLSGLGNKVTEEDYQIVYSHKDSQSSSNSKKDEAYGTLNLSTTVIKKTGKRSFARKGPYNILVGAEIEGDPSDIKPVKIIIKIAELRIVNKDNTLRKVDFSKNAIKWKQGYQEYKSNKKLRHRLWVSQHLKGFELDFNQLKEVILYIEFDGIYEDGTVKSYWSKEVSFPKYTREKYTPLIKTLTSG